MLVRTVLHQCIRLPFRSTEAADLLVETQQCKSSSEFLFKVHYIKCTICICRCGVQPKASTLSKCNQFFQFLQKLEKVPGSNCTTRVQLCRSGRNGAVVDLKSQSTSSLSVCHKTSFFIVVSNSSRIPLGFPGFFSREGKRTERPEPLVWNF